MRPPAWRRALPATVAERARRERARSLPAPAPPEPKPGEGGLYVVKIADYGLSTTVAARRTRALRAKMRRLSSTSADALAVYGPIKRDSLTGWAPAARALSDDDAPRTPLQLSGPLGFPPADASAG